MTYTSNKTISEMTGYFYNVTFTLNTCQRVGVRLTQVGHIKLNIYFLAVLRTNWGVSVWQNLYFVSPLSYHLSYHRHANTILKHCLYLSFENVQQAKLLPQEDGVLMLLLSTGATKIDKKMKVPFSKFKHRTPSLPEQK